MGRSSIGHDPSRRGSRAASLIAITAVGLGLPVGARAESGTLNLHVELAGGFPVLGDMLEEDPMTGESTLPFGAYGAVGVDWQLAQPWAIDLIAGGGYVLDGFPDEPDEDGTPYFFAGLGPRYRFIDNQEGYADDEAGDYDGNAWVAAHLGYHRFDGNQFGADIGGGYEWSVLRPIQLGLFARAAFLFAGDRDKVDAHLYGGISASFELIGGVSALDSDGDGLPDEREISVYKTDAFNPDTDGDGLNDGLEVRTKTNPTSPDTDGDGLTDGQEDANLDGGLNAAETDPRVADTDQGGVPDGWEVQHQKNPRDPADDDSDKDRVLEHIDRCPDTPPGEPVDANGCIRMRAKITLDGIRFAFDSAEILPESARTLTRARQILKDNPDVRVEVAGHTDNVGTAAYNRRLSRQRAQAVRQWLSEHEIEANRMTVKGYGATQPVSANDTDEGRAQNRRIEFRQLDAE